MLEKSGIKRGVGREKPDRLLERLRAPFKVRRAKCGGEDVVKDVVQDARGDKAADHRKQADKEDEIELKDAGHRRLSEALEADDDGGGFRRAVRGFEDFG
jgi:hypothetical protein